MSDNAILIAMCVLALATAGAAWKAWAPSRAGVGRPPAAATPASPTDVESSPPISNRVDTIVSTRASTPDSMTASDSASERIARRLIATAGLSIVASVPAGQATIRLVAGTLDAQERTRTEMVAAAWALGLIACGLIAFPTRPRDAAGS